MQEAAQNSVPRCCEKLVLVLRKNVVPLIAFGAAAISAFLVPPDAQYAGYFDVKTLCCLFGTLAVVCALKNIHFFAILARKVIRLAGNARMAAVALSYITFIGSMLIANDMALITFLPLGYLVFSAAGKKRDVARVFILQNIAANLGGMLTPFGNPQNLYLYSHFQIPTGEFMSIMLWPFVVSILLVTACCFLIQPYALRVSDTREERLPFVRTALYLTLFLMTILMIFRVLPIWLVLTAVVIGLLILDRKALTMVDYGLLATFVCFFIFSGNMSRLPAVRTFFSELLEKNHAADRRDLLSVYQQRTHSRSVGPVYRPVRRFAARGEYRRNRHIDRLIGFAHHLSGVYRPLPRINKNVSWIVYIDEFRLPADFDIALSGDRITASLKEWLLAKTLFCMAILRKN